MSGVILSAAIEDEVGVYDDFDDNRAPVELPDNRLSPAIGIATGVVLSTPFWAIIGWIIYSTAR